MSDYCSTAEVKNQIEKEGADADIAIAKLVTAASRTIDGFCNRPDNYFLAAEATKYYFGTGQPWLRVDECVSISAVYLKDAMTDTTYETLSNPSTPWAGDGDYFPGNGDHRRPQLKTPYNLLFLDPNGDYSIWTKGDIKFRLFTVKLTADFGGYAAVPADIKEAAIMQTARWWKRLQGGMADSLASIELGQPTFLQELDPDVKMILILGRHVNPAV